MALFWTLPLVLCFSKSLKISISGLMSSSPQMSLKSFAMVLFMLPTFSLATGASDVTFLRQYTLCHREGLINHHFLARRFQHWPLNRVMAPTETFHDKSHQEFCIHRQTKGFAHRESLFSPKPIFCRLIRFWIICNTPGQDSTLKTVTRWCLDSNISCDSTTTHPEEES